MTASRIISALACGKCVECARTATRGSGRIHCPAHGDEHASLSISARGRKVLVHCWSGCPQRDVIAALRERGLWR
jgi:hypothetical protein